MNAKCPECDGVATLDDDVTKVSCPHCGFEKGYDEYLEIMRDLAVNMSADYIPDRPGL